MDTPVISPETSIRSAFSGWPRWLQATVPVLLLVVVGIAAAIVTAPSATSRFDVIDSDDAHAKRLCEEYADEHGVVDKLFAYTSLHARDLRIAAAQFDIDIAPWDSVPGDHFIADCTFGDPFNTTIDATTPSTLCPNGDVIVTPRPAEQLTLYVDEKGRTSPRVLDRLSTPFAVC